jgi:hypothetical protein
MHQYWIGKRTIDLNLDRPGKRSYVRGAGGPRRVEKTSLSMWGDFPKVLL